MADVIVTVDRWGDSRIHKRTSRRLPPRLSRRRCNCGCERRATHVGLANGLAMVDGCELSIARWVKTGAKKARRRDA